MQVSIEGPAACPEEADLNAKLVLLSHLPDPVDEAHMALRQTWGVDRFCRRCVCVCLQVVLLRCTSYFVFPPISPLLSSLYICVPSFPSLFPHSLVQSETHQCVCASASVRLRLCMYLIPSHIGIYTPQQPHIGNVPGAPRPEQRPP